MEADPGDKQQEAGSGQGPAEQPGGNAGQGGPEAVLGQPGVAVLYRAAGLPEQRLSLVNAVMAKPSARTSRPVQESHRAFVLVTGFARPTTCWARARPLTWSEAGRPGAAVAAGSKRAVTLAKETTSPGRSSRAAVTAIAPTKVPPEEPRSWT